MAQRPIGKLAVILHADVVGSTALVQCDERRAHERITGVFQSFSQTIQDHVGVVGEIRGDALVAELSHASDAVCAALVFQQQNADHNNTIDDDVIPEVRVGFSLGEVIFADGTVTGAGVVLAQRVEQVEEYRKLVGIERGGELTVWDHNWIARSSYHRFGSIEERHAILK